MRVAIDFSEYKPWSGAQDTYDKIENEGKLDQLEEFLENYFEQGIPTTTKVNDLLWFESDFILESLGIENN